MTKFNLDPNNVVFDGYKKYTKQDKIWATWINDELIHILPPKFFDDIKNQPLQKLSFLKVVDEHFMWNLHVGDMVCQRDYVKAVKSQLNFSLPSMTDYIAEQTDIAIAERLAPPDNTRGKYLVLLHPHFISSKIKSRRGLTKSAGWRNVMLWDATLDIIHRVTAAVMVGPELAANKDYIHHARGYTEEVTSWNAPLFAMPPFLRVPFWWVSKGGRQIRAHQREVQKFVYPELRRRQAAGYESKNFSMLDGLLKSAKDGTEASYARIVNQELFLTFAAAGLFSVVVCQLILSVLGHPKYMEPLREEIERAVRECGGWNKDACARMPKLDSFLRETLRLSPPTALTLQRKVDQDIPLSNGDVVKAGTLIGFPTLAIQRDEEYYERPLEFDGYRFYDAETNSVKVKSVTQSRTYLPFGYGTQTCPGRFLATETSKIVFAKFLVDYEMRFTPKRTGKPVDWPIGGQIMPSIDVVPAVPDCKVRYARGMGGQDDMGKGTGPLMGGLSDSRAWPNNEMAIDSETDALIRPDSHEVGAADDDAHLWTPKRRPAGYKAMPVSFFASCAMAATAASTVYAYAHIVCKEASQCADGGKAAYASAVAVATTLANVCGLMAVGIYERLPTRAGLAVWIGLRAGSVVVLGAGVVQKSVGLALGARLVEGLATDNTLHLVLNGLYARSSDQRHVGRLMSASLALYMAGMSLSPALAALLSDFRTSFAVALVMFGVAAVDYGDHGDHGPTFGRLAALARPTLRLFSDRVVAAHGAAMFLYNAAISYMFPALMVHATLHFGFTPAQNGLLLSVAAGTSSLYLIVAALVSRPARNAGSVLVSLTLLVAALAALAVVRVSWALFPVVAVASLGLATPSFVKAHLVQRRQHDALAVAAISVAEGLGSLASAPLLGAWQSTHPGGSVLFVAAALAAASGGVFSKLHFFYISNLAARTSYNIQSSLPLGADKSDVRARRFVDAGRKKCIASSNVCVPPSIIPSTFSLNLLQEPGLIFGRRGELDDVGAIAMREMPDLRKAIATEHKGKLVLWVEPEDLDVQDMAQRLRSVLPHHAQPKHIVARAQLPLSKNGKLDAKALAQQEVVFEKPCTIMGPEQSLSSFEALIAREWRALLGLDNSVKLTSRDSFIALGGHSVLQLDLAARLRSACNMPLAIRDIIRAPVLADMAAVVQARMRSWKAQAIKEVAIKPLGTSALSPAELEWWHRYREAKSPSAFNVSWVANLQPEVNLARLAHSLNSVMAQHRILRSRFVLNTNGSASRIIADNPIQVQMVPMINTSEFVNRPFDLTNDTLVRIALSPSTLAISISHIICDLTALNTLLADVSKVYNSGKLAAVQLDYFDSKAWGQPLDRETAFFWSTYLRGLQLQRESEDHLWHKSYKGTSLLFPFPQELCRDIVVLTTTAGTTLHQFGLAATGAVLHSLCERTDIILGSPYMNRNSVEDQKVVGLYLQALPVRVKVEKTMTSQEVLRTVQCASQASLSHPVLWPQLLEHLNLPFPSRRQQLFDCVVTFHDDRMTGKSIFPVAGAEAQHVWTEGSKFGILFEWHIFADRLSVRLEYDTDYVPDVLVRIVQNMLLQAVNGLLDATCRYDELLHQLDSSLARQCRDLEIDIEDMQYIARQHLSGVKTVPS
ncbi:amp-dependent synthetase ligase [Stemphylium lycopersici]|nr:amp-dependent synthetase ligase [Stemphylium lycopersici]